MGNSTQSQENEVAPDIVSQENEVTPDPTQTENEVTPDIVSQENEVTPDPTQTENEVVPIGILYECLICYEYIKIVSHLVKCDRCSVIYCKKCFIRLLKDGHGTVTCPFCKYINDAELSSEEKIENTIKGIKINAGYDEL